MVDARGASSLPMATGVLRAPRKACDFGAENCASLPRLCDFVAADDAQSLRRNLRIFSADFASNARAPRAKTNAKMRALFEKACEIRRRKVRGFAARVRRRRRR